MRHLLSLMLSSGLLFSLSMPVLAQLGVGTNSPATSSKLDVSASDKGILIPRVALTGTNEQDPVTGDMVEGLLVYNTATAGTYPNNVTPGFYHWSGFSWIRISNQAPQYAQVLLSSRSVSTPVTLAGISVRIFDEGFGPELQIRRASSSHPSIFSVFVTVKMNSFSIYNGAADGSGGPVTPKSGNSEAYLPAVGSWYRIIDRYNNNTQTVPSNNCKMEIDLFAYESSSSYKLTVLVDAFGYIILRLEYYP